MNGKQIGYWFLTGLFCLAMGAAGVLNLIHFEGQQEGMRSLGYPVYLMTILGVAKLLGVIALWIPRTPLLNEWAYAGFTFDLPWSSGFPWICRPQSPRSLFPRCFSQFSSVPIYCAGITAAYVLEPN
ncbi:MAG: hypothetical protein Aurels2KO_34630 [Aureliella sp.]